MAAVRSALRSVMSARAVTAVAILSLAIGIGANTAIFSVVHALLLRPLPYANADRLVILWNRSPGLNIAEDWFSTAQYFDIKTRHRGFEQLAIALGFNANLTGDGTPERVGTIRVSSGLLPMLGAQALYGRLFLAEDDAPGQAPSAILSHGLWTRRYGADPGIISRTIQLNGQPYSVVGVLPAGFTLPREVLPTLGVVADGEIYLPLPLAAAAATVRTREDYNIIGTLAPGVTIGTAQREMDALTASLRAEHPDVYPPNGGLTFSVVPLQEQVVGDVRSTLWLLLGAVGCVLLIACANVANLLLSRALDRRKEIAVRAAMGATRGQIARLLIAESLVLATAGAIVGTALAFLGIRAIQWLQPEDVPRLGAIAINAPVLLFTLGLTIAAGMVFGLAPVLGLRRLDVHSVLRDGSRGAGANTLWGRGHHLRRLLVIAEVALSVLLLIGAGLLIRSYARLQHVSPGFSPQGVLTMELTLTGPRYPGAEAIREAYRRLWESLDALPGVTASGGVTALPMSNFFAWGPITIEGRAPAVGEAFINADMRTVAGRYFEAMQIPLIRGRLFTPADTPDQPRAVIIDERLARDLFPNADPIGKRLKFGDAASTSPWETIVGVVGTVKQYALDADSRIALYRPLTQTGARSLFVVVKAGGDVRALMTPAAQVVRTLDPALPIYQMQPMMQRVEGSLARRRFVMTLLALFAGVAVVLASIGIGGVMAYLVAQGTRELGIRLALGATPGSLVTLVLRQAVSVAALGAVVGLIGAFALTGTVEHLLFGIGATDGWTFAVMTSIPLLVAVLASAWPARRASRVDPLVSLRHD
ncbi:MAG TPA: ABC transporter permease [Vicinamibacterales bacterium]|nr:ABC transporter permease [Vicinamibacterales bacterium]